jgi:hypothetical protein
MPATSLRPGLYQTTSRRDLRRIRRRRRRLYRRRRVTAGVVFALAACGGLTAGFAVAAGGGPLTAATAPTAAEPSIEGEAGTAAEADPKGSAAEVAAEPQREGRPESYAGTGKLEVVPGSSEVVGDGAVNSFIVEVERGLDVDPQEFAAEVERTLFDDRGWSADGALAFERVDSGEASFRVALASPDKTDELCYPHATVGLYSCHQDGRAVVNVLRWFEGADAYESDLPNYRRYLVNHEVGHAIGHAAHAFCPAAGEPAPVMMQQTKGVEPCRPNPWPTEAEGGGP